MDDRSFELMEKMYVEFSKRFASLEAGQSEITQRLDGLEAGQNKLDNRMNKIEATLEHDIKAKLQALHERAGINTDKLEEHTQRLDAIETLFCLLMPRISGLRSLNHRNGRKQSNGKRIVYFRSFNVII